MRQEAKKTRNPSNRKFRLSDAMILVASAAVGFAINRKFSRVVADWPLMGLHQGMSFMEVWYWVYRRSHLVLNGSLILAPVLLVMRLRQPRPRFRRLMRQPGTVACFAVLFVVALRLLGILAGVILAQIVGLPWHEFVFDLDEIDWDRFWIILFPQVDHLAPEICLAVAASWVVLFLSGRWRPESSWIDRLGRVLGMYYILMIPFFVWWFPFSIYIR